MWQIYLCASPTNTEEPIDSSEYYQTKEKADDAIKTYWWEKHPEWVGMLFARMVSNG